jgi:hypothetical protein
MDLAFEVGCLSAQCMRFGVEGGIGVWIDMFDSRSGWWCQIGVVVVVANGWIAIGVLVRVMPFALCHWCGRVN